MAHEKLLIDFCRMINECGVPVSSLVKQFDSNEDGQLRFEEFQQMTDWISRSQNCPIQAEKIFNILDTKKDGHISPSELRMKLNKANEMGSASFRPKGEYNGHSYNIALVAHNNMKPVLVEFVTKHYAFFKKQNLCSTTSTGKSLERALGITVKNKTLSGPLGGDQELGGMIGHHSLDVVIFFRDPLSAHPHAADISALLRICDTTSTMQATNPATAHGLVKFLEICQPLPTNPDFAIESDAVKAYRANQKTVIEQFALGQMGNTNPNDDLKV